MFKSSWGKKRFQQRPVDKSFTSKNKVFNCWSFPLRQTLTFEKTNNILATALQKMRSWVKSKNWLLCNQDFSVHWNLKSLIEIKRNSWINWEQASCVKASTKDILYRLYIKSSLYQLFFKDTTSDQKVTKKHLQSSPVDMNAWFPNILHHLREKPWKQIFSPVEDILLKNMHYFLAFNNNLLTSYTKLTNQNIHKLYFDFWYTICVKEVNVL